MYFMGSEALSSASYILSDESIIPFYSTTNGYNQGNNLRFYPKNFKQVNNSKGNENNWSCHHNNN